MNKYLLWLISGISCFFIYSIWFNNSVSLGKGQFIFDTPIQTQFLQNDARKKSFMYEGFEITPLAHYEISAKVLSKKKYKDKKNYPSSISPIDFALAWQKLSDEAILDKMTISQRNRWYFYKYKEKLPLDQTYIQSHSSNHHLIPKDEIIKKALFKIKKGQLIKLKGRLVSVSDKGHKQNPWKSSLSRADTGDGACEIMFVESVEVLF